MEKRFFDYVASMLYEQSGLVLPENKAYLLESRLQPVARANGYETVEALLEHLHTTHDVGLPHQIVQLMTTNETMFFRDQKPFDRLRNIVLPALQQDYPERQHIRIWSAACSTGQEPYSLAITMQEMQTKFPGLTFEIVATDLCETALDKARSGIYTQFEVQRGMPIQLLIKYFDQLDSNQWRVKEPLKRNITYKSHNLLHDCSQIGRFDIVFCRNVLIYFDQKTKTAVLDRIATTLQKPGYLIMGSAETVLGLTERFSMLEETHGVYILNRE